MIEFRTHPTMSEVPAAEWNRLVGAGAEPFLRWEFLEALESTGCVSPDRGWAPAHLALYEDGHLCAASPAYLKSNSEGEFVFDHSWAEFSYRRLGADYYPKLLLACPFTPATGRRLLIDAGADEPKLFQAMTSGVDHFLGATGLSGAHLLFPRQGQADLLRQCDWQIRHGLQFHWFNAGYTDFEQFLGRYSSKRRNQIRRERRRLTEHGIELRSFTGSEITPDIVDHVFDFYCATVSKYFWGRQYLTRAFFEELSARLGDSLLIVLAYAKSEGRYVAGALNYIGDKRLFGRYWGSRADYKFLHFNVCYYFGIEECIRRGLSVFEPGAGGEHKLARGFEPTLTFSAHRLTNEKLSDAVGTFLTRERLAIADELASYVSPLRPAEH